MTKTNFFTLFFTIIWINIFAQPIPSNGTPESKPQYTALTNVKIIVSADKTIEKGTILIEGNKIKEIGNAISIPTSSLIYDYSNHVILPAFIETTSDIGMPSPEKEPWTPKPQLEKSNGKSSYWNQAIKAEINAYELFDRKKVEEKEITAIHKKGFGFVNTHYNDGIIRGTGTLIAVGNHTTEETMVAKNTAGYFSFKKGNSKQTYPSSQMGVIALIKQAIHDALYYEENKNKLSENITLDALSKLIKGPIIIEVSDHLEIMRAQKLAQEFNLKLAIVGPSSAYQSIDELKKEKSLIYISKLDFPKAYDLTDPLVTRQIPLSHLKNWELAPSNNYFLSSRGVDLGITGQGVKNEKEFWENLQKSIERGASAKTVLNALTTTPAKLLKLDHLIGTLEQGKLASFSVFKEHPLEVKNSEMVAFWSLGKAHSIKTHDEAEIRGKYSLKVGSLEDLTLTIKGKSNKLEAEINIQSKSTKAKVSQKNKDVLISFNHDEKLYLLHGKHNSKLGIIEGQGQDADGEWIKWAAIRKENHKATDSLEKIKLDSIPLSAMWYPNMAYGFRELPKPKTYVIRNATLWTNEKEGIIKEGNIMFADGKITHVGKDNFVIPANAIEIDAKGLHVTSGIIDEHSHIAISKGVNEGGQSITAEVSIGDVIRNNDINIYRQLSGGVTAAQLLHGSANAIGGQSALIKLKWGFSPEEMKIENAPKFIKFALGENVKQSNWGDYQTVRFPQTRMGVEQLFYDAFIRAKAYTDAWKIYNETPEKKREKLGITKPAVDLELEVLSQIMAQERDISCHSYVQSEINMLMHVADSMGFKINTFTHILEGYKLADKMRNHGAGGSTFSDWWGYKFEVNDAIPFNASLMHEQGIVVAINSDDAEMGRRLNQEASKVLKYGGGSEEDVWKMVTLNPAKLLHLDDRMGSLKKGKDADIVIWTANPLSLEARVSKTFIDGLLMYDYLDDERKRAILKDEKARLLSKMSKLQENGESKEKFKKEKEHHWHCDTVGDFCDH